MAEAIQWANRGQPTKTTIVAGRRVVERIPQTATYGDYTDPRPAAQPRWRLVVDSYGNEVRAVLTTAAADLDVDGSYGRLQRQKWRFLGWFEIGACPCTLFLGGELKKDHFVSEKVLAAAQAGQACKPGTYSAQEPCPHAIAERDARRVQSKADLDERLASFKTEAEKIISAQASQNKELVSELAGTMADAVKAALSVGYQAGQGQATPAPAAAPKGKDGK